MLPQDFVKAVFDGLKILAADDQDRARERNGIGFNKVDNDVGHSMAHAATLTEKQVLFAATLLRKYHRQLPQYVCDQLQSSSDQ